MLAFIDSNIPMYLVGAEHSNKFRAKIILDRLIANRSRLITDVEVYQEILHRYVAINRREAIQPCFDLLDGIIDEKIDITLTCIERTKSLVLEYSNLSARDAMHIATMESMKCKSIVSFDSGFDIVPGIDRIFE